MVVPLVRLLIENNAKIDIQDNDGNSPLGRATFNTREDGSVIIFLLDSGANPYMKNNHGVSPLILAQIAQGDIDQFFDQYIS